MLHPALRGARACVFDAGGTLVHPDWPRLAALAEDLAGRRFGDDEMRLAFCEMLKRVNVPRPGDAPVDQTRRHWTFRAMYGGLGLDDEACEAVVGRIDESHAALHVWRLVDPDAARVVDELKARGLLVAVISNTEDGRLRDSLEAAGLADKFDLLVDSHLVGCKKPDPAIFRLALGRLGVAPGEAAFVGDSYAHDALAARAVGMRAILLDPLGLHPGADCARVGGLADLLRGEV